MCRTTIQADVPVYRPGKIRSAPDAVWRTPNKLVITVDMNVVPLRRQDEDVDVIENDDLRKDYFIQRDGETFAGTHLLIDLKNGSRLDDLAHIKAALIRCVTAARATLLRIDLHHFEPNGGVSGVAILAESHISIHSWPEHSYAALDVFMCGGAEPYRAIDVLKDAFETDDVEVQEIRRGKGLV